MTNAPAPNVIAAIVLFHPERDLLLRQYTALRPQVRALVYYDNAGGRAALTLLGLLDAPAVHCLGDGDNRGLAFGLNEALDCARRLGSDLTDPAYALLLDQDSVPAASMVSRLRAVFEDACPTTPIAAVGPRIIDALLAPPCAGLVGLDPADVMPSSSSHTALGRARARPREVDFLITSGTLLSIALLDVVGAMDASLFIDCIDFDWSFRARACGYRLLAAGDAHLDHRRGERMHQVLPGLQLRLHACSRLFYIFRNHVRLYFRPYVPLRWKLRDLLRLATRATTYLLFVPGRRAHLHAMTRGLTEGFTLARRERHPMTMTMTSRPPRLRRFKKIAETRERAEPAAAGAVPPAPVSPRKPARPPPR